MPLVLVPQSKPTFSLVILGSKSQPPLSPIIVRWTILVYAVWYTFEVARPHCSKQAALYDIYNILLIFAS
jgi:hypothetical protein